MNIEDHFDKAYELEAELEARGKLALLEVVKNMLPSHVNCIYIRQTEPLGLGHAVLCARPVVGNEPFAVLLADDLMDVDAGKSSVTNQMVQLYEREHASVLAVQEVPWEETRSYGIVSSTPWNQSSERVSGIVEKPDPKDAPTNLAVVGRYVLNSQIFDHLEKIGKGAGGEIQLTDAIASLLHDQPVLAYRFEGTRFDCGSKLGYLKATVELGLKHPEVAEGFASYLNSRA